MSFLPGMSGIAGMASSQPIRLTYINHGELTDDLTTYDFGSFSIPRSGLVIVTASARNGTTNSKSVSSVSIGGTNGTLSGAVSGATNHAGAIARRRVAAGTHNVTVTFSEGMLRAAVDVWLIENNESDTPFSHGSNDTASATAVSTTAFNIPARGVAIFQAWQGSTGSTSASWSSATERSDRSAEIVFTGADLTSLAGIASHTETATFTGGANQQTSILAAAWR